MAGVLYTYLGQRTAVWIIVIEGEAVHNDNVNKALRISTGEGGAKDLQYILHFTRPPGVKGGGGGG